MCTIVSKVVGSSEVSEQIYQTTRRHILQDFIFKFTAMRTSDLCSLIIPLNYPSKQTLYAVSLLICGEFHVLYPNFISSFLQRGFSCYWHSKWRGHVTCRGEYWFSNRSYSVSNKHTNFSYYITLCIPKCLHATCNKIL
jgi:hypothetical protein